MFLKWLKTFFLSTTSSYDILHHVFPSGGISFPSIPVSADFPIPDLTELWLHRPRASQSMVVLSEPRTSRQWVGSSLSRFLVLAFKPPRTGLMAPSAFTSPAHCVHPSCRQHGLVTGLCSQPFLVFKHLFLVRETSVLGIPSLILFCCSRIYSPWSKPFLKKLSA